MRHLLVRLLRLLSLLLAVSFLTFLLLDLLPGDPTLALLGPAAGNAKARNQLRHALALDKPFWSQYWHWLQRVVVHGDLGHSYVSGQSVISTIGERLPITLELMILAIALSLVVAIPLGVLAARKPNGWFDRLSGGSLFAALALPPFMLGVLLIFLFAVRLRWLPATGYALWFHFGHGVVATPISILLPVITLAAGQIAVFARILRSEMILTLHSDYILAAKAKGLREWRVLVHHALRPSSFSLLTLLGLSVGALVGGTLIVEVMFALPGMGQLIVTSIFKRDYLVVQGSVLLVATAFVLANFAVDILYGFLDPRIRHDGAVSQ